MVMREKKLDSGLKQKAGPDDPRRKDSPFSPPNPGVSRYDYREHSMEYDPRTGKPKYKGQKSDSESSKRTVSEEALSMRREREKKGERPRENAEYCFRNPILDIWNAKIDLADYDITSGFELDENHRELARKIYTKEWDELSDEEKEKIKKIHEAHTSMVRRGVYSRVRQEDANPGAPMFGFGSRPDLKEEFSKPRNTGKTDEWRSALGGENTDSEVSASEKPKEPEKKAKPKTTEERFEDFLREKPKDSS